MNYTIEKRETESYFENPFNETLFSFTSTSNSVSNMNSNISNRDFSSWEEAKSGIMKDNNILNQIVYVMNHSYMSLSLTPFTGEYAQFDSYPLGIVTVNKEQAKKYFRFLKNIKRITKKHEAEYNDFIKDLPNDLSNNIDMFEGYINGETYTEYVVMDEDEDIIEYFETEKSAEAYIKTLNLSAL